MFGHFCLQMLDEIQAGIFDGWTYEDIEQQMPQEYAARKADKLKYRCDSLHIDAAVLWTTASFILATAYCVRYCVRSCLGHGLRPCCKDGRRLSISCVVDTVEIALWQCRIW